MGENELYHYGVLGMKWGHRKAQKNGNAYSYKSHTTKKYEKKSIKALDRSRNAKTKDKAVKFKNKSKVYDQRAKRSAKLDSMEQEQSLRVSTAKTIGARAVAGALSTVMYGPASGVMGLTGIYSKSYQRYRALGDSKVRAMAKTGAFNYPMSMVTKANYIRGKGKYASK